MQDGAHWAFEELAAAVEEVEEHQAAGDLAEADVEQDEVR